MSSVVHNFNLNNSVPATTNTTARRRSATISVPAACIAKSNVHVSVSVSLPESLASISAWAAQIAPGAPPATPSPRRSSFYSLSPRTPSFSLKTPRRSSLSATFLNFWESPSALPQTPAPKAVSPSDLLAQGYTSIFVHLSSGRRGSDYAESILKSPSPYEKPSSASLTRPRTKSVSVDKNKATSLTRLRSLSFKGRKLKASDAMPAFNVPPVPALPSHKSSTRPTSPRSKSDHSKKPKSTPQARYGAILGPGGGTGALPLAQEIALAQMLDGGSFDVNVRRVTERHAKATGTHSKASSARDEVFKKDKKDRRPIEKREAPSQEGRVGAGVSGVYRDTRGGLWWDEDESIELTGLLPSSDIISQSHGGQVPLGNSTVHNQKERRRGLLPRLMTSVKPPPTTSLPAPPSWVPMHSPVATEKPRRKGSVSDSSSPDTDGDEADLDPAYAVRPRDATTFFAAAYSMNVEKERHLRRAPHAIDAFGVSPLDSSSSTTTGSAARARKERKRPAPLTLPLPLPTPHAPASGSISSSTARTTPRPATALSPPPPLPALSAHNGPTREENEGRQEFFASAFAPLPARTTTRPPSSATPASTPSSAQVKSKVSRRGSLSLGLPSFGLGPIGKAGRRASLASASPTSPVGRFRQSPYTNGSTRGGSSAHLALSKITSRPSTASGTGADGNIKVKASRSRLAGLFKRS